MLESRYGAKPFYSLNDDPEAKHVESVLNSSQGTVGYADSDATEEYWPVDVEEAKGTVESDSTHSAKKPERPLNDLDRNVLDSVLSEPGHHNMCLTYRYMG